MNTAQQKIESLVCNRVETEKLMDGVRKERKIFSTRNHTLRSDQVWLNVSEMVCRKVGLAIYYHLTEEIKK